MPPPGVTIAEPSFPPKQLTGDEVHEAVTNDVDTIPVEAVELHPPIPETATV